MVEQRTFNPFCVGSSPTGPTAEDVFLSKVLGWLRTWTDSSGAAPASGSFPGRSSTFDERRSTVQSRCRSCSRAWYEARRDGHIVVSARRNAALRAELEAKLAAYFAEHPCVDCGERDIRCLEFDHRDRSTKTANIAGLLRLVVSWKVICQEIAKCDVRCANCHRRRTAAQVNSWRHQLVMASEGGPR